MSEQHGHEAAASGRAILAGVAAAALVGGVAGILAAAGGWPRPNWMENNTLIFLYVAMSGLVVGGGTGLVVGLVLAWHGAVVAADGSHPDAAPLWGGITGLLLGLAFGPLFGFVLGLFFHQIPGGTLLGLICGPLLGLLAWQTAYWLPRTVLRG